MGKYQRILAAFFATLAVLFFQNCSDFASAPNSYSGAQKSSGGNGNTYDGKIEISAPDSMTPGQPVEIVVTGGSPPYVLTSSSGTGNFIKIDDNRYVFTVEDSSQSNVTISATDQTGETVSVFIMILGINRWFFEAPTDLASGLENDLYVLESDGQKVTHLADDGKVLATFYPFEPLGETPKKIDYIRVSNNAKSLFMLSREARLIVDLDVEKNQVTRTSFSEITGTDNCKDFGEFLPLQGDKLVLSCLSPVGLVFASLIDRTSYFRPITVSKGSKITDVERLGSNLLLTVSSGEFLKVSEQGVVEKRLPFKNVPESNLVNLDFGDTLVMPDGNIAVLSNFKRFAYIFNSEGVFLNKKIGNRGQEDGRFQSPRGLVSLPNGLVAMVDKLHRRIQFFNSSGMFQHLYGPASSQEGAFNLPWSLMYDKNDQLYVLDKDNHRFQVFRKDGAFSHQYITRDLPGGECWNCRGFSVTDSGQLVFANRNRFRAHIYDMSSGQGLTVGGSQGQSNNQLNMPEASILLKDGRLVVADTANHRLQIFDSSGRYLRTVGSYGRDGNEIKDFARPCDIEVDEKAGRIFVLQQDRDKIHIFDMDFKLLKTIYSADKSLDSAVDMALDSKGRIYLADPSKSRIVVIDQNGNQLKELTNSPFNLKPLDQPYGVAVASDGRIAVADTYNHRIQVYPPLKD